LKFIYDNFKENKSWKDYFLEEGDILYHKGTCGIEIVNQLVLPSNKRRLALQLAHDSILANHMSNKKTLHRLASVFFWPTMKKEVRLYCKNCRNCQLIRKQTKFDNTTIKPVIRNESLFHTLSTDIFGPIPKSSSGHQYVLLMICHSSKFLEAEVIKSTTSKAVCEAMMKIFCRTAVPTIVYSDCASCYTSKLTEEFEQKLSISPKFITPRHSAGNGLIERQVQTFKRCLLHIIKKYEKAFE